MQNNVIGRPDLVRAINQRWLLKEWNRIRGNQTLPAWEKLQFDSLETISATLSFADVIVVAGQPRFRIRFHGTQFGEIYGSHCVGKFLDEILPVPLREAALSAYRHVVEVRQPFYTISQIHDENGCVVHYERLLLPFGNDGETVDRTLTSLEMVSQEGAFQSRNLMKSQTTAPTYICCATIQH